MALAVPGAVALAADDQADGSFCDAISVDELNAIGPLQFEPSEFSSGAICVFEPASQSDSYTLTIVPSGFSFDMLLQATPDAVEVTAGDRPALFAEGSLHVGLDDGLLSINLEPGDSEAAADVDLEAFSVAVAALAVPAMASVAAGDDGAADAALAPPPEIEGIEWNGQNIATGQDLMQDEAAAALWQSLLDATGADPSQLVLLNATARDDERQQLGRYDAIQVTGADGATFRSALLDWLRSAMGDDAVFEDLTVAGKDVVKITAGGEVIGYLYFDGDTAHTVTLPEELVAQVIEALP